MISLLDVCFFLEDFVDLDDEEEGWVPSGRSSMR